jgi:hypothetical protein
MGSSPAPATEALALQPGGCRACRIARAAVRGAVFVASGIAVSLIVAWAVSIAPWLGVLLGLLSTALFARTLLVVFFRPSPITALTHMAASVGLGIAVAALVGLLVA